MRARRRINDSDEGVATTVGTIMALLIFLSLLSMISQQYVPVWMEDKEAYHMDESLSQFSYLKGNIDNLIMNDYADYPLFSTVKLGSEGVPLFASQTTGLLSVKPQFGGLQLDFFQNYSDTSTRNDVDWSLSGQGNISLDVNNRYFEPQTVIYENGAIILEQDAGSIIRGAPPIRIEKHSDGNYSVSLTIIDMIADERRVLGAGSVGVSTELWSNTRRNFQNNTEYNIEDFSITISTKYTKAWSGWLRNETDIRSSDMTITNNRVIINLGDRTSDIRVTYSKVNIKLSV